MWFFFWKDNAVWREERGFAQLRDRKKVKGRYVLSEDVEALWTVLGTLYCRLIRESLGFESKCEDHLYPRLDDGATDSMFHPSSCSPSSQKQSASCR